jgi:hypothetical protein
MFQPDKPVSKPSDQITISSDLFDRSCGNHPPAFAEDSPRSTREQPKPPRALFNNTLRCAGGQ